jgi:hypothetical protein
MHCWFNKHQEKLKTKEQQWKSSRTVLAVHGQGLSHVAAIKHETGRKKVY